MNRSSPLLLALFLLLAPAALFARAGGGDGGGYSGGGYSSSDYGSSDYGGSDYSSRSYSRGYHSHRSRRYRNMSMTQIVTEKLFIGVIALVVVFVKTRFTGKPFLAASSPSYGRSLPEEAVGSRSGQVTAILKSLASRDPSLDPDRLSTEVRQSFINMQRAWQEADYSLMEGRVASRLMLSHSQKARNMRSLGEKNIMGDVTVQAVHFVHVRMPPEPENRFFTVLITASARDYTVGLVDGRFIGGSMEPRQFQEYWTFELLGDNWVPARIDQISEDGHLSAPNLPGSPEEAAQPGFVPAPRTPSAAPAVLPPGLSPFDMPMGGLPPQAPVLAPAAMPLPGFPAMMPPPRPPSQPRPPQPPRAAPALPGAWDKRRMEMAAVIAFLGVYGAWEKGDPAQLPADALEPEAAGKLARLIADRRAEGLVFELGGLHARKAEIVLTEEAAKSRSGCDEFTARITAVARRGLLRGGAPLSRDEGPEPFIEYWVFSRSSGEWKFRDVLPRMPQASGAGAAADAATPVQLEWYWRA